MRVAAGGRLSNAPPELTSFVGRGWEVPHVRRLLKKNRLVALVGAGACGKTRLAIHAVSSTLRDGDRQGWFVDLAPVRDGSTLPAVVTATVGVREQPGEGLKEVLVQYPRREDGLHLAHHFEQHPSGCRSEGKGGFRFGLDLIPGS